MIKSQVHLHKIIPHVESSIAAFLLVQITYSGIMIGKYDYILIINTHFLLFRVIYIIR